MSEKKKKELDESDSTRKSRYVYSKEQMFALANHPVAKTRPSDLDPIFCRDEPDNLGDIKLYEESKTSTNSSTGSGGSGPLGKPRGRVRKQKDQNWTGNSSTSPTSSPGKDRAVGRKELKRFFIDSENPELEVPIQEESYRHSKYYSQDSERRRVENHEFKYGNGRPNNNPDIRVDETNEVRISERGGRQRNFRGIPESEFINDQLHGSGNQELKVPADGKDIILSPPKKLFPSSQLRDKKLQQKNLEKRQAQTNDKAQRKHLNHDSKSLSERTDEFSDSEDDTRSRYSNHSPKGHSNQGPRERLPRSQAYPPQSHPHLNHGPSIHGFGTIQLPNSHPNHANQPQRQQGSVNLDDISPEQIAVSGEASILSRWFQSSGSEETHAFDWLQPHLMEDSWNEEQEEEEELATSSRGFGRWFNTFPNSDLDPTLDQEENLETTQKETPNENGTSLLMALFGKQNLDEHQKKETEHSFIQNGVEDQEEDDDEQILFQGKNFVQHNSSRSPSVPIPQHDRLLQTNYPIFDLNSVDPALLEPLEPEDNTSLSQTPPIATISPIDSAQSLPSLNSPITSSYESEGFSELIKQHNLSFGLSSSDNLPSLQSTLLPSASSIVSSSSPLSSESSTSTPEILQKLFISAAQKSENSLLPQLRALQTNETQESSASNQQLNTSSPITHDPSILSVSSTSPNTSSTNLPNQDISWFQSLLSQSQREQTPSQNEVEELLKNQSQHKQQKQARSTQALPSSLSPTPSPTLRFAPEEFFNMYQQMASVTTHTQQTSIPSSTSSISDLFQNYNATTSSQARVPLPSLPTTTKTHITPSTPPTSPPMGGALNLLFGGLPPSDSSLPPLPKTKILSLEQIEKQRNSVQQ